MTQFVHWFELVHRSRHMSVFVRVISEQDGEYVILNGARKSKAHSLQPRLFEWGDKKGNRP